MFILGYNEMRFRIGVCALHAGTFIDSPPSRTELVEAKQIMSQLGHTNTLIEYMLVPTHEGMPEGKCNANSAVFSDGMGRIRALARARTYPDW